MFDRYASAGFLFNLTARLFERRIGEALRPLGVAPAYLPTLLTLSAVGESTQSALAAAAEVEQSTMALTLQRMERDGLIAREPDPSDRRRALIRLTKSATAVLPEIERIATAINREVLRDLEEEDAAALMRAVVSVSERLQDKENIHAVVDRAVRSAGRATAPTASSFVAQP